MPDIEAVDGKGEQLLDRGNLRRSRHARSRNIAGAVGRKSNVNDGMIQRQFVESQFAAQQREPLDPGHQALGVRQGNVGGGLAPVHGNLAHIHLHAERDSVNAADFHPAAGNALQLGNHAAPDQSLEGFGGDIPQATRQAEQPHPRNHQQVLPPCAASRPGGGLGHWLWYPSRGGASAPGMRTSLSERRLCSQETSSSLTFSWVSSSLILAETSASGTSLAPVCFSCGTNFSR